MFPKLADINTCAILEHPKSSKTIQHLAKSVRNHSNSFCIFGLSRFGSVVGLLINQNDRAHNKPKGSEPFSFDHFGKQIEGNFPWVANHEHHNHDNRKHEQTLHANSLISNNPRIDQNDIVRSRISWSRRNNTYIQWRLCERRRLSTAIANNK